MCVDIVVRCECFEPVHASKSGIVEEDVYPTKSIEYGLDCLIDLGLLTYVETDCESLPALGADLFGQRGQPLHAAGGQHDDAAFLGKPPGGVCAESGGSPGDQDNFVGKCVGHEIHSGR